MEKNEDINNLVNDLDLYLSNIQYGDGYIDSNPALEDGFQLDLYLYLKEMGYQVVYELELPKLKPFLNKELNEAVRAMGYVKDSLRPDLVVDLGSSGLACLELKYNETDMDECAEDLAKCRVYVKHCKDVHFAGFIHLHRNEIKLNGFNGFPCADDNYEYDLYGYTDNPKDSIGFLKAIFAKSIRPQWLNRLDALRRGEGKFAEFDKFE